MTTPITPSEPKCATCRHRFETRSLTHTCTAPGCWCYHGPTVITPSEPKCIRLVHDMTVTSSCDLPASAPVHHCADDEGGHPFETYTPVGPPMEPRCEYPSCGKPPKHRHHKPCNDPFSPWCRSSTCHPFTPAEPPAKCEGCWHPPVDHWQGVYECTRPGCQCPSLVTAEPPVDRYGTVVQFDPPPPHPFEPLANGFGCAFTYRTAGVIAHCMALQTDTTTHRSGEQSARERIVAAAIKDEHGIINTMPAPARHHDLIRAMAERGDKKPIGGEQGFITSTGRFAWRKPAKRIAREAGQLLDRASDSDQLFSEDVW